MKWNKLLAVALALVVLVTGTGVFAFAQGVDGLATPTEVTDGVQSVSDGLLPAGDDQPGQPEEMSGGEYPEALEEHKPVDPAEKDAAAAETRSDETMQEPSSGEKQPEENQQNTSSAVLPGSGVAMPENAGSADAEAFVSAYAYIPAGTVLYRDKLRDEELGEVVEDAVMLVREVTAFERGSLYEAFFDTALTVNEPGCEHAYFYDTGLRRPDREQTEVCIATQTSYRTLNHVKVFTAEFRYAEEPETPEQPEEPDQPEESEQPGEPEQPEKPDQPGESEQPGEPYQPEEPEQPEEPYQPGESEQPGEPEQPAEPEQSEEPEQPGEPEQPAEPEQPEETDRPVSRVNTNSVNMRREPDVKARLVVRLHKDTPVEVLGQVTNDAGEAWYSVRCEGQEGYIRADLVDVAGEAPGMDSDDEPEQPEASGEDAPAAPADDAAKENDAVSSDEVNAADETPADPGKETDHEPSGDPEGSVEAEMPAQYTIAYFGFAGEQLMTCEVRAGEQLDEEFFLGVQGDGFLGWYLCDEYGTVTGETPYVFGQPVEHDTCLRACSVSGQSSWDTAAAQEDETLLEAEPIEPQRRVDIAVTRDTDTLQLGSRITLTASLTGYEDTSYTCRWQYAAADRSGNIIGEWQDAPAEELSYTYTLSEENLLTAWRMCVTINEP